MVANLETLDVGAALEYLEKEGLSCWLEYPLQPVVKHVATCIAMEPICLDGALDTLFGFLTGHDCRVEDGSLSFKATRPQRAVGYAQVS